jgi:hypothetical protein
VNKKCLASVELDINSSKFLQEIGVRNNEYFDLFFAVTVTVIREVFANQSQIFITNMRVLLLDISSPQD